MRRFIVYLVITAATVFKIKKHLATAANLTTHRIVQIIVATVEHSFLVNRFERGTAAAERLRVVQEVLDCQGRIQIQTVCHS